MKKVISIVLILTTLFSVGSMCFASDFSQEKNSFIAVKSLRLGSVGGNCLPTDEQLRKESSVLDDLLVVSENESLQSRCAGFLAEVVTAIVTCYLVAEILVPIVIIFSMTTLVTIVAVAASRED